MPVLMPEVESALAAGASRFSLRRSAWRRPRRGGLLAVAAALIAGTALAATTPWRPLLGNDEQGHPSLASAPLPANQLARLAVLRRPQDDADHGDPVPAMLTFLAGRQVSGVHVDGIRVLARRSSGSMVLIPVERRGELAAPEDVPARGNLLCLMFGFDGGVAQTCGTTDDLNAGRIVGSVYGPHDTAQLYGLAPDGVDSVVVTYPDQAVGRAAVNNNSYVMRVPVGEPATVMPRIRWLDSNGKDIGPDAQTAPASQPGTASPGLEIAPSGDGSATVVAPAPAPERPGTTTSAIEP